MAVAGDPTVIEPPSSKVARVRAAIERIRPTIVGLGIALILVAFVVVARSILSDYQLRVIGVWNGVTGSPHGISEHASNKATAELAVRGIQLLTGVVGVALAIPRRSESAAFRAVAWAALVLAAILAAVSVLGFVGLSAHKALGSFDPRCPVDGPCRSGARAMAPADWLVSYTGGLGVAATSVGAILAACVGARWIFWGVTRLLGGGQPKP